MANQAAWIPSAKAQLEIKYAPLPKPQANEVLIQNKVVAINPIDYKIQQYGAIIQNYPAILGFESSGIVQAVGSAVTRFKKADRVAALSVSIRTNNTANASFQTYMTAPENVVACIPDSLPFTNAAVLPLGLATAAAGLYQPEYLHLTPPSNTATPGPEEKSKEKVVLIWGGSSAVGSSCIQLCATAGLFVLTTCSSKNFDYVRDLGADLVFDYTSPSVVEDIISAIEASGKRIVAVYDTISSEDTAKQSAEVLHRFGGGRMAATGPQYPATLLLGDVERFFVQIPGTKSDGTAQVWMEVWREFMEEGLRSGKLRAKPEPIVKEGGLGGVQGAMDVLREGGVSAAKIVVTL
ncbi:oxidoreductase [Lophiotrema nucula]|uniref:Oxidoreductase n=1 Tax=Lophiotrema nucula TaxID=690887 RepID=A0A6A5ZBY2_9PLEO|nr:oxidoreductase [Lophiotrema nucula]